MNSPVGFKWLHPWYAALRLQGAAPGPGGPVLLCPYVLVTGGPGFAALGNFPFSTFDYTDGVATGTVGAESETQAAMPEADANTALPGGTFSSVPANSGKVAMEMEVTVLVPDLTFGVEFATYDGGAQIGTGLSKYLGNLGYWVAEQYGDLVNGLKTTRFDGPISVGDRVGLVVDTDTGLMDFINPIGHENFSGNSVIDLTNPGTFVMSALQNGDTGSQVKMYTKASDMELPYPPGTTDSCGNPVSRELVTYPMTATAGELAPLGISGKLDPSLADQRGSIVIPDSTSAGYIALAELDESGTAPKTLDLSQGSVAYEAVINVPEFTPTDGQLQGVLYTATVNSSVGTMSMDATGQGTVNLNVASGSGAIIYSDNDVGFGEKVFGVLIDNGTGALRVWIDGSEVVLTDATLFGAADAFFTTAISLAGLSPNGSEGTVPSVRLITEPHFFTTPFPAGSRDINGNVFN